jgi:phenylacetic acid degradation operon negative regulatory protein
MQPKIEEFLNLLLWSADLLARPTFRNLTDSYESWAYRNGLMRQVATLERQQLLERDTNSPDDRLYRLSAQGRLHVLGGRDPEERWARPWDGQWRLVLFDVPTGQNSQRERLRRYLRDKGFGYVQNSVWITPDPLMEERQILGGGKINVESLLLLEARPCAGESDAEIVAGADSAVRLPGATGVAAAGGSAPGRQPATAHVQTRIALCKLLLHMQQKFVMGAGGNGRLLA